MGGLVAALLPALAAIGRLRLPFAQPVIIGFYVSFALASMVDNYAQLQWGSQERDPNPGNDTWSKKANIVFLVMVLLSSLERARGPAFLPRTGLFPWLGIGLIAVATALRSAAVFALGKRFKSFMDSEPEGLVTSGIFSKLRHPSYLGALLLFAGVPIALSSALGTFVAASVMLPPVLLRIREEESFLGHKYGEAWNNYAGQTAKLIPRVY